ncbi:GNAT family N-acetyltransferase [Candidatus Nitrosomarinus catalina]|uniref:GNAT family N-acetyltransferase n=1 Tax=Candidatus Nitrosomarinus catalinensis TaxID=1898749 RepID=UPI000B342D45|nr:GNAT family N-acetyltransferase [Candidatus Nitrosomarinus catalina]
MLGIKLRQAEKRDWDLILDLRNASYKFFYKQNEPISHNEHYKYMENQIKNNNFHQWIITHNNEDAGYVRILDSDVSIMVDKEYQNKGIASIALFLLEKEAKTLGIKKLVALVAPENKSSQKIFQKNNYILKLNLFEKDL